MIKQFIKITVVAAFAFAFVVAPVASATTTAVYDAVPEPLASSYPSLGFEATQTAEFGAKIQFAAGERKFDSATIVMNSWACENGNWNLGDCVTTPGATFTHDITLNIYQANEVLTPITTVTQTFSIPFRPSANPTCGNNTQWQNDSGQCQNGFNVPVTFDLNNLVLPDEVVFGVTYNTSNYGNDPTPGSGPADSLNVSLTQETDVTAGNQVEIYRSYPGSSGFAPESGWDTNVVAAQFNAVDAVVPPAMPQSKDDCKKDGWKTLVNANGDSFKNQGQCVSYVTANENAKAKRATTSVTNLRF